MFFQVTATLAATARMTFGLEAADADEAAAKAAGILPGPWSKASVRVTPIASYPRHAGG